MNSAAPFRNPLCVALDVDSADRALTLAKELSKVAGGFKLGPRLLLRTPGLIKEVSKFGPVFVDCKFFDIASTMKAAIQTCYDEGASLVTIHAMSGHEAMGELSKLETQFNKEREFRILAVSILTSWTQSSYPPVLKEAAPLEHVKSLSQYCLSSGIAGLVCSAQELEHINAKDHYVVTPGIRRSTDNVGDQKRVMGPKEAIQAGSNLLVVGRPIIEAADPLKEAQAILAEV